MLSQPRHTRGQEETVSDQHQARTATLVVGATGDLGGRVVREPLASGNPVRALVRDESDPTALVARGVDVVRGDLLDPASLDRALDGVGALITTAQGYMPRRKGDSLAAVDDRGNRNLVDAARRARLDQFVFTSVLGADKARGVQQFWQKKLIEDHLEASGVPFVALRPGAFIGGAHDYWARDLKKGRLTALGKAEVPVSSVHIDDVARYLARAVEEPQALGRRIDIGMDRALSFKDLAEIFSRLLDRPIKLSTIPWTPVNTAMALGGVFSPRIRDFRAMLAFFASGQSVANTAQQAEVFGSVPTAEETLHRYLREAGLRAP